MEAIGADEETAAISLGASGWQMFWRVTVPNIKRGPGLRRSSSATRRAMGEFGAVYVVSGHIRGTDRHACRCASRSCSNEYNLPGSVRRGVAPRACSRS